MNLIKTTDNGLMKFKNLDAVAGNTLALMLEVRHTDLMRTIKKVMKYEKNRKSHCEPVRSEIVHIDEEKGLNFNAVFKEWEYTNNRGRKYSTFIMNEDALYLVIANSQGKKAHELKVLFKSEFNKMKAERNERELLKNKHLPFTNAIKIVNDKLGEEGSGAYNRYYATVQRQVNKVATGRPTPQGMDIEEYRCLLSEMELKNINTLESLTIIFIDHFEDLHGRTLKDSVAEMLKGECAQMFIKKETKC